MAASSQGLQKEGVQTGTTCVQSKDVKVTVRNTFIEVDEEDDDEPLFRSVSDPLGGQRKLEHEFKAKAEALASVRLPATEEVEEGSCSTTATDDAFDSPASAPWPSDAQVMPGTTCPKLTEALPYDEQGKASGTMMQGAIPVGWPMPLPLPSLPMPSTMPLSMPAVATGGAMQYVTMPAMPAMPPMPAMYSIPAQPLLAPGAYPVPVAVPVPAATGEQGVGLSEALGDEPLNARGHKDGRKGRGKGSKGKNKSNSRNYILAADGSLIQNPEVTDGTASGSQENLSMVLESSRPENIAQAPTFGKLHKFHPETARMGTMAPDGRTFTKEHYMGRLSVITEDRVHTDGIIKYTVQFCSGELSSADGLGFIFSNKLPCPKNIQKIVSIFANKTGRICVRAHAEVVRSEIGVKPLELGDWIELLMDLDARTATFTVWPADGSAVSCASLCFGSTMASLRSLNPSIPDSAAGYAAVVVKNTNVTVALAS
mmetsp:Transcript_61680/g.144674  ORF Transcript_61680/g.144674 Transcript_61680/m.144674 type:complete len:484 (-) Transcript_61680:247-1698(-)